MRSFPNIRLATPADAGALLNIYRPYIERTAITFEMQAPEVGEFAERISLTLQRHPYLVYEEVGEIKGYAYASAFKGRAAYDRTVETSIYINEHARRGGLGRQLYAALESLLAQQGIQNVCACISHCDTPDPLLPPDSEHFHERMGYGRVAHFHRCAYKFGRWWDMVWMEKFLGAHPARPVPFTPLPELIRRQDGTVF